MIRVSFNSFSQALILLLVASILAGCGGLSLKAAPIPESAEVKLLVSSSTTALNPDTEGLYPFNHAWSSGYCATEPQTSVYVTPIDVSRINARDLQRANLNQEDVTKLAEYARKKIERAFSQHGTSFRVVETPPNKGRIVQLSLVELSSTEVIRNLLGTALGVLVPGGGLISAGASGAIGVEGVVKEAGTGKPLFVFADRERGKIAPFSFNDFRALSHARVAIDDWSNELVESCAAVPGTRISGSSAFTLVPL